MIPKITIITPSFNQGHYIEETIESVLSQNYSNLEYIIMDGGSSDNTVEIIKKYDKHIAHWESVKDKGQSDAINKGFKIATGEVINWLNSDDYYEPHTLHKVGNAFIDLNTNVFCGRSKVFGIPKPYISNGTDIYETLEKTIAWARIDQPETFFRKSVIDKIGLLNQDLHYCMDKEMWIRFLIYYGLDGIKKTSETLVNFRIHGESKTNNFQDRFLNESDMIFNSIFSKFLNFSIDNSLFKTEKQFSISEVYNHSKGINWEKVRAYFYLQKYFIGYAQDNMNLCRDIEFLINLELIDVEDVKEFNKVKTRIKYLPIFLKKIINKFR